MMRTTQQESVVEDTVHGMWEALSQRDWHKVGSFLAEDCLYTDMPVGPTLAARGPDGIVKRLKIALEPLAGYIGHPGLLVTNGVDAMYEHSETWTWATGETALLKFVSVHRVVDSKISRWKDYWDMAALRDHAPPSWYESFENVDLSWVYDATGQL